MAHITPVADFTGAYTPHSTGQFTPFIPRDLRLEVIQRMDSQGHALTPLDEAVALATGQALLATGCDSLVVRVLHTYAPHINVATPCYCKVSGLTNRSQ